MTNHSELTAALNKSASKIVRDIYQQDSIENQKKLLNAMLIEVLLNRTGRFDQHELFDFHDIIDYHINLLDEIKTWHDEFEAIRLMSEQDESIPLVSEG